MGEETITALDKEIDKLLDEIGSFRAAGEIDAETEEKINAEIDDLFDF